MTHADLQALFDAQYQASRAQVDVPLLVRRERLLRMRKLLDEHGPTLAAAVQADFGVRSQRLTEIADMFVLRSLIGHTLRHLARWMKPQRVGTPLYLQPASAMILRQPLGVVGVVAPWNYPVQLALAPAITALAAGNRVMIKPSELTPHTSAQLAQLLAQFFTPEEVCVVQGDATVASAFSALPFDHLVFTGSTAVGRKVAQAARRQPDAHHAGAGWQVALHHRRQLRPEGRRPQDRARQAAQCRADLHRPRLRAAAARPRRRRLPKPSARPWPSCSRASRATPTTLPSSARATWPACAPWCSRRRPKGPTCRTWTRPLANRPRRRRRCKMAAPAARWRRCWCSVPPRACSSCRKKSSAPVLPVISYERLDDAITHINSGPRPLALYWFGNDTAVRDDVLRRTVSGGVTVNDTLMHIAHDGLPFGGVGDSGWGAYHGEQGFLRFCHQKSVLVQSRWAMGHLFYPPYGPRFDQVMGLLRRLF
jgi:coniferyl-aldehyde dehydrogenase